jgi:hypothetical protein
MISGSFVSPLDYVSVFGFQDSGGALNVQSNQSHFLVARLDG